MNVIELTRKLIAFNTVSAKSNELCIQFLIDKLRDMGFSISLQDCSIGHGAKKLNLIATKGEGGGGLMLAGHSDTVPFRPNQQANLVAVQEGGRLYGRGSCDMKGAIAAQLLATQALVDRPLKRPLTLAYTCDEEVGCLGAKRLIGAGLIDAAHAIVGEPTSLRPIRTHKGYIGVEVSLKGVAAHSSDPERGRSAILAAARAIGSLEAYAHELERQHYDAAPGLFHPDFCTLNVGKIAGGVARNVIAEHCRFVVELRPLPGQEPDALIAAATQRIRQAVQPLGVKCELDVTTRDRAMETPPGAEVLSFLEERSGARSGAVSFGTEGKEYNQMGVQTAIFGPGSIDKAHQEDEYVPLDELEASVDHYRAAIEHFCL